MMQRASLHKEYRLLDAGKEVEGSSDIRSLNPFIDQHGLIRVGGRLQHSTLRFEAKHPIILPKRHPVTDSIINHFHQQMLHAGPQSLLASIRLQYWPIGGRKTVSRVVDKCIRCFRAKPKLMKHIMGSLPSERVHPGRTFLTTGVDFCGPFHYQSEVRNRPPIKCYVSLFICFTTKAIHLELVKDLSTQSFLAALKRFVYTRGSPGSLVPCRALLDSASQLNFVTNRLANQLQLKKVKSTTSISGIGQIDFVADHMVDLEMHSRIGEYQAQLSAVVTPSITDAQPLRSLNNIEWKIPSNVYLADPLFFESQRVDVLIGASLFFELLCVGQIRLSEQLALLQKTKLGWIVSGEGTG
ncbi:uncharacterized protein LOC118749791, partial [Rhagoletis pomonella]|uniref:uncharacterized protein LOC118749791 n=1 Tax=Rhagoletis pomonella TaxID=28610 RepID=UPI00177D07AF